ncbi:MAG: FHA domain-containing protein [Chromatiales bacterium]|nr:FHA domain-containing protein [Chromatiales bacterium]
MAGQTPGAATPRWLGLDANDAALTLVDPQGVLATEPGYAVSIDGLRLGADAAADLRRQPLLASTRHWRELGVAASAGAGRLPAAAELVGTHLDRLLARAGQCAGVVVAVPGGWHADQAAALRSLLEARRVPAVACVDGAVAVHRAEHPGHSVLLLEAGLHGLGLTRFSPGEVAAVAGREWLPQPSIEALLRVSAEFIARRFIEATRYDPLHSPASEQALFDALPGWLQRLQREPAAGLVLEAPAGRYEASIPAAALRARVALLCEPLLQQLRALAASRGPLALLVHHRLAEFPGVVETLLRVPRARVVVLPPGAAAHGALARLAAVRAAGGGVVATLPLDQAPVTEGEGITAAAAPGSRPTHVLFGHRAWRLDAEPFLLGTEVQSGERGVALDPAARGVSRRHCTLRTEDGALYVFDHSRFGTVLNGHRIQGSAVLEAGDVLALGSPPAEFRLIAVEEGDGPADV